MICFPDKAGELQSWGVQEGVSTSSLGPGSGNDQGFAALVRTLVLSCPVAPGFFSLSVYLCHEDGAAAVPPRGTSASEVAAAAWYPRVPFLALLH